MEACITTLVAVAAVGASDAAAVTHPRTHGGGAHLHQRTRARSTFFQAPQRTRVVSLHARAGAQSRTSRIATPIAERRLLGRKRGVICFIFGSELGES